MVDGGLVNDTLDVDDNDDADEDDDCCGGWEVFDLTSKYRKDILISIIIEYVNL